MGDGRTRDERGFVLAWAAISITVLLGFAALAVDLGNWYLHIQRTQRAVDAAALAGDPWLPGDESRARQAARNELLRNGVPTTEANTAFDTSTCAEATSTCIARVPGQPTQLEVRATSTVQNTFLHFLGAPDSNVFERRAIATHLPPIKMSSMNNLLGNEPLGAGDTAWQDFLGQYISGEYWLQVMGGESWKGRGDRFLTKKCVAAAGTNYSRVPVTNCAGTNQDRDKQFAEDGYYGYEFHATVEAGTAGSDVAIEVFDAVFAEVGDKCEHPNLASAVALDRERYAPNQSPFCTGDHQFSPDERPNVPPPVTYMGVAQNDDRRTAVPGCPSIASPVRFDGYTTDIATLVQTNATFAQQFRKWYRLCSAPLQASGTDYVIRVWTDPDTAGHNQFSMRAAVDGSGGMTTWTSTKLFAEKNLPVYANYDGANTRFYMAQVPEAYGGTPIELQLFDIGDSTGRGSMRLLLDGASGGTCEISGHPATLGGPGWTPMPNCQIYPMFDTLNYPTYDGSGWNGKVVTIRFTPPAPLNCRRDSCMLRMDVKYDDGIQVDDASTWSINAPGQPLHLIK